ncbi:MAG: hypothetical protein JW384_00731 [Nitrosomonadaceae bacterium]|nr:hypothetical protein [Nitrosomonadaceae bacterium]
MYKWNAPSLNGSGGGLEIEVTEGMSHVYGRLLAPKYAGQILLTARTQWKELKSAEVFQVLLEAFGGTLLSQEGREVIHCQVPSGELDTNTVLVALKDVAEELTAKMNGEDSRTFWAALQEWSAGSPSLQVPAEIRTPASIAHQQLLRQVVVAVQSAGWTPAITAGIGRPDLLIRTVDGLSAVIIEIKSADTEATARDQLRLGIGQVSGYLGKAKHIHPGIAWSGLVVLNYVIDWSAENLAIESSQIQCCDLSSVATSARFVSERATAALGPSKLA